ncbi:MAG TPA: hypothetical protein VG936_13225 [Lacunisphaera sp.]|nr:hypothetical protein [Lacunisphaera sp.]
MNPLPSLSPARSLVWRIAVSASLGLSALLGAEKAAAPKPPATHTLYMGADLAVEWKGQLRPVKDVRGTSFVVDVDGHPLTIPAIDGELGLKIDSNLKISRTRAEISNLQVERAYTPGNDPRKKYEDKVGYAMGATGVSDLAGFRMRTAQLGASLPNSDPNDAAAAAARAQAAEGDYQRSLETGAAAQDLMLNAQAQMNVELARELYDAFRITFVVSSAKPLNDPYVVIMVRFREKAEDPKTARMLVYAQSLAHVDQRPDTFRLFRGGLPPGFQIESEQIHLYDHGVEVATSVSPKQTPLTAEEAYQVALIDYSTRNRDKSLAPVAAPIFWPEDARARLHAAAGERPFYVRVGPDGRPVGAFEDEGCARPLANAEAAAVVAELRFLPALEQGKPAAGITALNPALLPR